MTKKLKATEIGIGHTIETASGSKLKVYYIESDDNSITFKNQVGSSYTIMKDENIKVHFISRKKYSFVHEKNGDPKKLKNLPIDIAILKRRIYK